MEIRNYEAHGRKLLVEFECRRCKKTEIRPLADCMKECTECYRDLYDLQPPKNWENGGFYYPMFCPDCSKAYADFMNNKDVKRESEDK